MNKERIHLNTEQKIAYDMIMEGENIFISGGGGTGKTVLLRQVIDDLQNMGKQVLVCSYTSFAATLIGGSTIHRTFGFPIGPCLTEKHQKIIRRTNINNRFSSKR